MRKMLFTLALVAAPAIAVAQQAAQQPVRQPAAPTVAVRDTTKAKPKTSAVAVGHHKKTAPVARDTSKAKPATRDTTRKP